MPRVSTLFALLCLCFPFVVGCDGCRNNRDPAEDEQELEAPLEDFTARPPQVFPGSTSIVGGGIKPGHWTTASQSLRSNKMDARGELVSRATVGTANSQTANTRTMYGNIPTERPVVLPKGQMRRFDFRILPPIPGSGEQTKSFLESRFVSNGRSTFFDTGRQPFNVLAGEEYFFVVLTSRPQRFAKFQVSDWVRPFQDSEEFKSNRANYRIVFPPTDDVLPLAETMLDWTSTAVLLWDDLSADALTPQQLNAIEDWVHFGGQFIVNGATAADAVSKTSLNNVLALAPSGNIELESDAATELLEGWAVANDPSTEKQIALLKSQSGRVAIDGRLASGAVALPNSGNLLLTRRVGLGQVVQPRFDVTSDWLANWKSYDSFVNSVLLSRPRRQLVREGWLRQQYPDGAKPADPALNTRVRISSRDAVLPIDGNDRAAAAGSSSGIDPLTYSDSLTGIGGWTDTSDAIVLCQEILRSESGIEIPSSSLVVRSLGYYLLILVPINYLIFRILGRLEYAWLAVPVIAIGGAIWVARSARLDIGFARSQTEIALLELQPGYDRGHLSRVVAIYNSLSSQYDVELKTIDGAAAPVHRRRAGFPDDAPNFRTGFSEGPVLSGVAVGSNQVRMIHTEQVIDVGGSVVLDGDKLINQSSHELLDTVVVEKQKSGKVRVAAVGLCESGSASTLRFRDDASVIIAEDLPIQTVSMMQRLAAPAAMPRGSTRLVARIDGSVPGISITPNANQSSAQTMVLAHLMHASIATPMVDMNLLGDFQPALTDADEQSVSGENP